MALFQEKQINSNRAAHVAITGLAATTTTITASTIAFVDSNPDTITDSGSGFGSFVAGDRILITNGSNDGFVYTIETAAAGTLTLVAGDNIVVESVGTAITIEVVGQDVSSALTTAATTAGKNGGSVTSQASTGFDVEGWLTAASNNYVQIADATSKEALTDTSGNEIFARLTDDGSAEFTLSYFTLVSGVETPHFFASSQSIVFLPAYNYEMKDYPHDAAIRVPNARLLEDGSGANGSPFEEEVNISGVDTLADLTKTPVPGTKVTLEINGKDETETEGGFTRSGKALTWVPATAGYNLATTLDVAIAKYNTFE